MMHTSLLFPLLAILNGSLIAVMIQFNTILGLSVGVVFSILIIQLSGFILTVLIAFIRPPKRTGSSSLFFRIGGLLGVPIVLMNTLCFINLGASLTLACGLLGQSITSILADSTGLLGMRTYRFNRKKIIGFSICFAGILLMSYFGEHRLLYILLAFSAGIITILQMIINSQLALRIGLFRSVRNNFVGGIIAALLFCLAAGVSFSAGFEMLGKTPFPVWVAGGWIGVLVVFLINWILPKIPTVYTSLLQFSGQIIAAVTIDVIRFDTFSPHLLAGSLIILIGMAVNVRIDMLADAVEG